MSFCPVCGKEEKRKGAKFCASCGKSFLPIKIDINKPKPPDPISELPQEINKTEGNDKTLINLSTKANESPNTSNDSISKFSLPERIIPKISEPPCPPPPPTFTPPHSLLKISPLTYHRGLIAFLKILIAITILIFLYLLAVSFGLLHSSLIPRDKWCINGNPLHQTIAAFSSLFREVF